MTQKIGPEDRTDDSRAASNDLRVATPAHQKARAPGTPRVLMKGGESGMREKSSRTRIAITIALDWRFVLAAAVLVLTLLLK